MRKFMLWLVVLGLTAAAATGCCANKGGHKAGDACCAPGAKQGQK